LIAVVWTYNVDIDARKVVDVNVDGFFQSKKMPSSLWGLEPFKWFLSRNWFFAA